MNTKQKVRCPYCGSDDVYQDNANSLLTILTRILRVLTIMPRPGGFFSKPELNTTYHCFNCHKEFNKGKIIKRK